MKSRSHWRNTALALGALTLLGGSFAAPSVRAQDAGVASDKPITLNLQNVPIQTALKLLFTSAGIRNYSIAQDVQGNANISVQNVPFSTALTTLLNSANATFTVDNGSYNVSIKRPTPPPAATIAPSPNGTTIVGGATETSGTSDQPRRFYPIPINKYDAYYIALLLGAQGVVQVGVNDVIPANVTGGGQGQGQGRGGFGGTPSSGISSIGGSGGFGGGGFGGGGRGGYGGGGFGGGGRGGFGGGGGFSTGFAIMNPSVVPAGQ